MPIKSTDIPQSKSISGAMLKLQYPYIWLFCGFAALGACLYGYDGVYFNGVSTLGLYNPRQFCWYQC